MNPRPLPSLSALALQLGRGARSEPAPLFIDWALEALKHHLPFDSGLWATGHIEPNGTPLMHTQHLHRQPMQMLADYQDISHFDVVLSESVRRPGVSIAADINAATPRFAGPWRPAAADRTGRCGRAPQWTG